jgi:hypothetical protein
MKQPTGVRYTATARNLPMGLRLLTRQQPIHFQGTVSEATAAHA